MFPFETRKHNDSSSNENCSIPPLQDHNVTSSSDDDSDSIHFEAGDNVTTHDIQTSTDLNGQSGKIHSYVPSKERFRVKVVTYFELKPGNLTR